MGVEVVKKLVCGRDRGSWGSVGRGERVCLLAPARVGLEAGGGVEEVLHFDGLEELEAG